MNNWRYQQFWHGGVGAGILIMPFVMLGFLAALATWPRLVGSAFLILLVLLFAFPEWASTVDRTPRITLKRIVVAVLFAVIILHFVGGV